MMWIQDHKLNAMSGWPSQMWTGSCSMWSLQLPTKMYERRWDDNNAARWTTLLDFEDRMIGM
jgi:steroid 5-alpha reductase family enzyme